MSTVAPLLAGPVIVPERIKHAGGGMGVNPNPLRTKSQVRSVLESAIGGVQVWLAIFALDGVMV